LYYILNENNEPVPEKDFRKWSAWFHNIDNRRVARDKIKHEAFGVEIEISTVFLGLDHSYSRTGDPVLFETIIFNGEENVSMDRYCTWKEAEKGHQEMVSIARDLAWVEGILNKATLDVSDSLLKTKEVVDALKKTYSMN